MTIPTDGGLLPPLGLLLNRESKSNPKSKHRSAEKAAKNWNPHSAPENLIHLLNGAQN